MNLVDSCGWLEYFADGPAADFYAPALEDRSRLLVPTICLFEVFKKVVQQRGEDAAIETAAVMQQCEVIDLDESVALTAARISHAMKLPMADSVILATATLHKALIWTQDIHFANIDGVKFYKDAR
jgi:predicted nucleic acid-binding protein